MFGSTYKTSQIISTNSTFLMGNRSPLSHREPIQELWTDLLEESLFKPKFVLSLGGRGSYKEAHVYIVLYRRVRRGGGRGEEGWGEGGRVGGRREGWEDCQIWQDEQRSLVRQEINTNLGLNKLYSNKSVHNFNVWAPCAIPPLNPQPKPLSLTLSGEETPDICHGPLYLLSLSCTWISFFHNFILQMV